MRIKKDEMMITTNVKSVRLIEQDLCEDQSMNMGVSTP